MIFKIGGQEEILIRTGDGFSAESMLKVLQLLRDKSPDSSIREGASLFIRLIAKFINSSPDKVSPYKLTISTSWLEEMADINRHGSYFITAFVNQILQTQSRREETTQ